MTFADALVALDRAVTAFDQATALSTLRQQSWTEGPDAIERFARGKNAYRLSDSGARLTYSITDRWCMLSPDANDRVRDNFEQALPERRALEKTVAEWLNGRRSDHAG